jgi:hypothetical protein
MIWKLGNGLGTKGCGAYSVLSSAERRRRMERFDEMLAKLNDLSITSYWEDGIPDDIWEKYLYRKHEEKATGLDVDTHRWYEISTTVWLVEGRLLGIRHVSNIFSESMGMSDCGVEAQFFEMEEVTVTSYRPKRKREENNDDSE